MPMYTLGRSELAARTEVALRETPPPSREPARRRRRGVPVMLIAGVACGAILGLGSVAHASPGHGSRPLHGVTRSQLLDPDSTIACAGQATPTGDVQSPAYTDAHCFDSQSDMLAWVANGGFDNAPPPQPAG